jgi:hypothetical protein
MNIKGAIMDHMGHFSVPDIPGLVVAIVVAIALGYLVGRLSGVGDPWSVHALWAGVAALATALVGAQLSVALVLVALLLLVRPDPRETSGPDRVLSVVCGMGCGAGASLITLVAVVPLLLLLRRKKRGAEGR